MSDYYDILGVNKQAALADIKKAYRKLARKFHPDLNPGDKIAESKFKEINEAYEVLKDPVKRKRYDTFGELGGNYNQARGKGNFEGFDFTSTGANSFGDIFETLFGAGRQQSQTRDRSRKPGPGEDLIYSMNLSFLDAANGLETPIQVVRKEKCTACDGKGIEPDSSRIPCPVCGGSGRIQKQTGFMKFASICTNCGGSGSLPGKTCRVCSGEGRVDKVAKIKVRIPAGVDHHSKVRIAEKGNAGKFAGPTGDLIITIDVSPHKFFRRNGSDLEITIPITYLEAALGAKVEIPTLDGISILKIPPSSPSGQKMRLKNKGVLNPKTRSRGDMIIELKIVPPPIKDIEVRQLLKEIEKKAPYNPRTGLEL
ncbi:MAG: molecular chaperone DnaJ [Candidatus Aminicenantes bacterium]|nr:molecular chaperone DnaJ [Candidatus Aminicenantes bacterium]